MNKAILEGVRVLDFGTYLAGAATTMHLARLGAEVIKIEAPLRPDGGRYFVTAPGVLPPDPRFGSQLFCTGNVGKMDLSLDISQERGKDILRRLIEVSDVLYENMTPGTMAKHGFDYEAVKAIKPDIIYVSSSSCGQEGPERNFVGYAANFANKSGLGHLTGYEGSRPSLFVGSIDMRSANMGLGAILTALYHHAVTGKGQYVDLASQEAIAAHLGDSYLDYIVNGNEQGRQANKRFGYAPQDAYPTNQKDVWVAVSVENDGQWRSLCACMGMPGLADDERYSTYEGRAAHEAELDEIVAAWTRQKGQYEAVELLQAAGVPAAPCLNSEGVYKNPHFQDRGIFVPVEHRDLGTDYALAPPWRFAETPASFERGVPLLGEHTSQVLKNVLGMGEREIRDLAESRVIRRIFDYDNAF